MTLVNDKNKTPGQLLRTAREAQSLSSVDIAKEMHLSVHAIEDLERDEYSNIGVRTFVRGYLVTYGRIVGVSQALLLEAFELISPTPAVTPLVASVVEGAPVRDVTREHTAFRYSPRVLIGAGAALVLLIGLIVFTEKSPDIKKNQAKPVASAAQTIVIPAESTAVAPAPVVENPVLKTITPAALAQGEANPGSNTPFVHKHKKHHVKKKPQPAPFTVTPVTNAPKTS